MPNWCENTLTVYGEPADIEKFISEVEGSVEGLNGVEHTALDFYKIDPTPEALKIGSPVRDEAVAKENIAKHGHPSWYEWQVAHWGCKWPVDASLDRQNENTAVYTFDSAWSPPLGIVKTLSEKYPTLLLHISFDEPGGDFGGFRAVKAGKCLAEDDGPSVEGLRYQRQFEDYRADEWLEEAKS